MRDTTGGPEDRLAVAYDPRFPPHRRRGVGIGPPTPTASERLAPVDRQRALEAAVAGPVGLLVVDEAWRCAWVNEPAAALVGRRSSDLVGVPWLHYVAEADVSRVAEALVEVRRNGVRKVVGHEIESFYAPDRAAELAIVPMDPDGRGLPRFAVAVTDVSDRRRIERRLATKAHYDALTGLPNRSTTVQHITDALARRADGETVVVTFVDLDDFKPVNETYGHPAGDQVLVAVARRLRLAVADDDLIGRVGGDEFAGCSGPGPADPGGMARRILRSLSEPIPIAEGHSASVGASVGVSVCDDHHADLSADEMIRQADTAMYSAKRMGGGRFVLFSEADLIHGPGPLRHRRTAS